MPVLDGVIVSQNTLVWRFY